MPNGSSMPPPTGVHGKEPLAMAALLARKRRYAEAAEMVRSAIERREAPMVDALDLLGRIFAQQGIFLRAQASWEEARRLAPEDGRFVAALAALRRAGDPRRRLAAGLQRLLIAALVVAALGVSMRTRNEERRARRETSAAMVRLSASLDEMRREQAAGAVALDHRWKELGDSLQRTREATSASMSRLATSEQVEEWCAKEP